jgi:hypothetical protein
MFGLSMVLCFAGCFVGVLLLLMANSETPLPEWLFPVRGRWLRYLLAGSGVLLALPLLLSLALVFSPLLLIWGVTELVARWNTPREKLKS